MQGLLVHHRDIHQSLSSHRAPTPSSTPALAHRIKQHTGSHVDEEAACAGGAGGRRRPPAARRRRGHAAAGGGGALVPSAKRGVPGGLRPRQELRAGVPAGGMGRRQLRRLQAAV